MNAWDKQVDRVFNDLMGQASGRLYQQISGQSQEKPLVQQRVEQVMALAARGDKSGVERLIRSWPAAEARQVQAALERR
ncbi:hypothetical protein [Streptomyces sp. NPDC054865]